MIAGLRPVRAFAAAAAVSAVGACAPVDGEQARLCRGALTALEPAGRIVVLSESRDRDAPAGIAVRYRVTVDGVERESLLRCGFGGGRLDDRRLDLRAVEIDGAALGEARLLILKRFWLADGQAQSGEEHRLEPVSARPLLPFAVGAGSGYLLQQVVNALPLGAIYALIAVAYALVYGLIGRINLAFGEIAVVAAYAVVSTIGLAAALAAAFPGAGIALALAAGAVAALQAGLLGGVIGRSVFAPLAHSGHRSFLIATIGLAIALAEAVRLIASSRERWIQPFLNEPVLVAAGDYRVTVTTMQALETGVAAAVLAAVALMMRTAWFGRPWRAVADDALMARLLGADPARIALLTFAISAAIAGVAGALTALHYGHASYSAGLMIGLKALVAALLGGIGSIAGAALGGLAIGLAETLWSAYLPLAHRDAAILALLVIVLVLRPDGLFGRGRPEASAADLRWSSLG